MKLNPDKWHPILKIDNLHIKKSLCEKLLSINFDYKLNFAKHIEDIYQKVSRKFSNEYFLLVAI